MDGYLMFQKKIKVSSKEEYTYKSINKLVCLELILGKVTITAEVYYQELRRFEEATNYKPTYIKRKSINNSKSAKRLKIETGHLH